MSFNSDVLHEVLTTILQAYRSPLHAFGTDEAPDSWASYGDLTQKLLGLIARAGQLPASVDDLSLNDRGKLAATLSNELQLAEKHATAVIHAQCKFMQAVAQAAVDAVDEVAEVLNDKDAEVGDDQPTDAPQASAPQAEDGAAGVPEAHDLPSSEPGVTSNPPAPQDDRKPELHSDPGELTSGPVVLPEPTPEASEAPKEDEAPAENVAAPEAAAPATDEAEAPAPAADASPETAEVPAPADAAEPAEVAPEASAPTETPDVAPVADEPAPEVAPVDGAETTEGEPGSTEAPAENRL